MNLSRFIINKIKQTPLNNLVTDSDNREIVKGAGTTFILKIIGLVFSYGFNIFFARVYGAEVMGLFALAITVASIFSLFAQMGTQTSLVRFVAQYAGQGNYNAAKKIYKLTLQWVLPLSIFLAIIFYFLSPFIANSIFHKPKLIVPLEITAFVLPFGVFIGVNTASLRGLKKIKDAFIFSTVLPPVLNTIGLMGLTYFVIKSYLTPIYVNFITVFIGAIYSLFLWRKRSAKLPTNKNDSDNRIDTKEIIKVSMPMFIAIAMAQIVNWTDTIMIGIFLDIKYVGIYRVAFKIAIIINFILITVNSISVPKYSELFWDYNKYKLSGLSVFASKIIFWASLPIYLSILIFNTQILGIFGEKFIQGSDVLIILATGFFLASFTGQGGYIMNMVGLEKINRNISIFIALLNIVLNYLLIQKYNIIGAALASAFTYMIWSFSLIIIARRKLGFWPLYFPVKLNNVIKN